MKALLKVVTIDPAVADTPIAKRYRAYAAQNDAAVIEQQPRGKQPQIGTVPAAQLDSQDHDTQDKTGRHDDVHAGHTLGTGKREVYLTRHKGTVVKQCTGLEDDYVCCNLHVMHQTTNCPLDCSYCILQAYINKPVTTVYADVSEIVDKARRQAEGQPHRLFRVGTGDLGDSLALDHLGGVSTELIPAMAKIGNVVLELKTKSANVDELLSLHHRGRTVVAWSVNTPHIIATEEHRCASLDERLSAAQRVVEAGYPVAFHFDPMVVHEGWDRAYPEVVRAIFDAVPASRVAWISMGALRFPPSMLAIMANRFPNTALTSGEFVLGNDRKMRYLKPVRLQLYRTLLSAIREFGGDRDGDGVFTYLCMEASELWRRVMGEVPPSNQHLDFQFSQSVVRRFPYLMPEGIAWRAYHGAVNLGMDSSKS